MKKLHGLIERAPLGKLLYGLLFCIALPIYLVFWASHLELLNPPSFVAMPRFGSALLIAGATLMIAGIAALQVHGGGLPMNLYPPPRYVNRGAFRWFAHPIYLGFCLACVGLSVTTGSGAGLWLLSPLIALGCVALVWGYERPALRLRFADAIAPPWFRLPPADEEKPQRRDVLSVFVLVFVPWLLIYEAVEIIGVIEPAFDSTLWFEANLPVWEISVIPYLLTYPFVTLAPFFAGKRQDLRQFAIGGLIATAIVIPFYLTVPIVAPFRLVESDTVLGNLLRLQQSFDGPTTAFPAFHVVWAFLATQLYCRSFPTIRVMLWVVAALIAISSWLTGMHALLDIVAGIGVYAVIASPARTWRRLLGFTEHVANSWREWRFGPVRLINHGLYAGMAATVGFLIVGGLSGPNTFWTCVVVGLSMLLAAGLWAQFVEGSDKLLRPFGYYGAMMGAMIGALLANLLFGYDVWLILAALSVAAPWIQAIGRLRCLVQGCCHGAATSDDMGIRYRHSRSRVCQIAGLGGRPLHPTQLYSIICNIIIGLLVVRLLLIGVPTSAIVGSYLLLSSLARFVEEAYRGEPQTPVLGGLKLYQWLAVAGLMLGSVFTMLPSMPVDLHQIGLTPSIWLGAGALGLLATFAMGVDWPGSSRRFSRLA
jgi:protein-S-isoprenylcysteine O-methyltransferase Ste14